MLVRVDLTHKDKETVQRFESEGAALDEVIELRRMFGLPDYVVCVYPRPGHLRGIRDCAARRRAGIAKVDSHLTMKVVKSPDRRPGGSK